MYKSTRGKSKEINSSEAMIKGIADDKGLYVPNEIPKIKEALETICSFTYKELATYILKHYLNDFNTEELNTCITAAYENKFEHKDIAPLVKKGDAYFLELYHGPTAAFKDMALCLFPHLLKTSLEKNEVNNEVVILTATSGDTGKAALEGFANIPGTKIIVFFPENGTSNIQKLQMTTQEGSNTFVIGLNGNFDDAQSGVKSIFNDSQFNNKLLENKYILSSANSINIGRFLPQIIYYFYAYGQLVKNKEISVGEKINVVVPTGNFGNILSAYYAKEMGLPINKFICASNENNILYDFLTTGIYDRRRNLKVTSSPSMDILISSNLERLLYHLSDNDSNLISSLMDELSEIGKYEISENLKDKLVDFYGGFATEEATAKTIKYVYDKYDYLIDPHTAVAYHVYENYKQYSNDTTKTIIASTASPYKFPTDVCKSLDISIDSDDFNTINNLFSISSMNIPSNIKALKNKNIIHNNNCEVNEMKSLIKDFLKVGE